MNTINIEGASLHNLKNINVKIPKNKLVLATGVSGSGKSSLMFDILFEEGKNQYLKSLGVINTLEENKKFDDISGLGPTIAVKQNLIRQSNPRSTVGSRTGLLGLLSTLLASYGQVYCPYCEVEVSDDLICPNCHHEGEHLHVNYFSYNHANGMCPTCAGRGYYHDFDLDKLISHDQMTLQELFDSVNLTKGFYDLVTRHFGDYFAIPFWSLPDEVRLDVLYGHPVSSSSDKVSFCLSRLFQGRMARDHDYEDDIYSKIHCSDCLGYRIGQDARLVRINNMHIGQLALLSLDALKTCLDDYASNAEIPVKGSLLIEAITCKLQALSQAKLGHLSLYREMPTLSGGEIQRLFLYNHLVSKLDSLIYILDEPTVGLHESEKKDLLHAINQLKQLGNTVILVEHDSRIISEADHIIDIGPEAGVKGGQLVYQGDYQGLLHCPTSITGQYLSGQVALPIIQPKANFDFTSSDKLTLSNISINNLKDITLSLPLGTLVGICGVSGSGKSSLVSMGLIGALKNHFNQNKSSLPNLIGLEAITGYCQISQEPIGRNINSNPATYSGLWDKIRKLYADLADSKSMNFTLGHFSFNSKGACENCGGSGTETIWLGGNFKLTNVCPQCHGKRFNDEALSIHYRGLNIYEVLELSITQAIKHFEDIPSMMKIMAVIESIGMGYIKLGQPTSTLSGGEAQRLKLAKELAKKRKKHTLYILDEPTTGLSLYDTSKLLSLLDHLIFEGHSIVVIEHDTHVLNNCSWLIELGPTGGTNGGYIISQGSPSDLKADANSITGGYL